EVTAARGESIFRLELQAFYPSRPSCTTHRIARGRSHGEDDRCRIVPADRRRVRGTGPAEGHRPPRSGRGHRSGATGRGTGRGDVSRKGPLLVDEWKFAQGSSKAPVKAVLTGPVTLASLSLDKHYGNKKALAGAFASAIGEEVGALVKAGASQIQIDEPILTQHPEDLSLVSEGLDRIRGHKAKATLTLFTFFGDVAG